MICISLDVWISIIHFLHSTYLCHVSPKLWILQKLFPSYSYHCLSNCHSLISIKNMNNVIKGEILMTYKKLFSFHPNFQNVRYACSLQSRKIIGHFNLSKVNFTGCWFQVKIYFKAELLHLCISLLSCIFAKSVFSQKEENIECQNRKMCWLTWAPFWKWPWSSVF